MPATFALGLDLGQAEDYTALAVASKVLPGDDPKASEYHFRLLKRWELGTPYTRIVADIVATVGAPPLLQMVRGSMSMGLVERQCSLAVDLGGPGRPVVNMLRDAHVKAKLFPVAITAGRKESYEKGEWHVSKQLLVFQALTRMQQQRVFFAPGLEHGETLKQELQNYRIKLTDKGNETFSAREGAHDDLVLAMALAIWLGERGQKRLAIFA
jgi:hypothetical protein